MTRIFAFFKLAFCKRLIRYVVMSLSSFAVILLLIDQAISLSVQKHIYTDVNTLPYRPYGLVLGTSKYFDKNTLNLFYHNRLLSAYEAFSAHKVDYLLLSGDNRTHQYNEPRSMFKDLRKMGLPQEFMYMDFAGFRTLDSVIRAKQVFNAHSFTIITQKFHCERALFIAQYYDIDAICFAAEYPHGHYFVRFREFFARIVAIVDLLMEKEPHFLGEPEPLPPPVTVPIVELDSKKDTP
ncbi:SanA/YdcF family protein [Pasteurella sp. P03HT]